MPVAELNTTQSIAHSLLSEYEVQAAVTRRFLERVPEEKLTWRPHEKSMTAGQLAYHIAALGQGMMRAIVNTSMQAPDFKFPQPSSREEILKAHDESVAAVREQLPLYDDAAMRAIWRLLVGEKEMMATPRGEFVRNVLLNHWYQHRGQLSVYLRLLDVPVPSSWGPSADEPPPFVQRTNA